MHRPVFAALLAWLLLAALVLGQTSAHGHIHGPDGDEPGSCALCLLAQQADSPLASAGVVFQSATGSALPPAPPPCHQATRHDRVFLARAPPTASR